MPKSWDQEICGGKESGGYKEPQEGLFSKGKRLETEKCLRLSLSASES
jgi:hypothetical protein